jgi:hypothetical protein
MFGSVPYIVDRVIFPLVKGRGEVLSQRSCGSLCWSLSLVGDDGFLYDPDGIERVPKKEDILVMGVESC